MEKMRGLWRKKIIRIWVLCLELHKYIHEKAGFPNHIYSVGANEEITDIKSSLFGKEPDGKTYDVFHEEGINEPYILIHHL